MATLNAAMAALVDELADEGMPDVLAQRLTLAAVWADLARLTGEELPAWVAARLDAPAVDSPGAAVDRPTRGIGRAAEAILLLAGPRETPGRPGEDADRDPAHAGGGARGR